MLQAYWRATHPPAPVPGPSSGNSANQAVARQSSAGAGGEQPSPSGAEHAGVVRQQGAGATPAGKNNPLRLTTPPSTI